MPVVHHNKKGILEEMPRINWYNGYMIIIKAFAIVLKLKIAFLLVLNIVYNNFKVRASI